MNTDGKPKWKKETRCCIDLGSSYFRMLSVEAESGEGPAGGWVRFADPLQERSYIGWGEEVLRDGSISSGTAERAAVILRRLAGDAAGRPDARLTVVATNTLRIASNRANVRKILEDGSRTRIHVLSEKGEALLGFAGATSEVQEGTRVILVDLGGTSTELSWGRAPAASACLSLPVGSHSRHVPGNIPEVIARAFDGSGVPRGDSPLPGRKESHTIMFTGGTAVSLAVIWKQMLGEEYDDTVLTVLSVEDLGEISGWLYSHHRSGTERQIALPAERIALLDRGISLAGEFFRALGARQMTITARDLRWGVVLTDGITERGYLADEQESPDSR